MQVVPAQPTNKYPLRKWLEDSNSVYIGDLKEVRKNSRWKVNNFLDKNYPPFAPDEIVERAIDELKKDRKYHLTRSNCEHLAYILQIYIFNKN